MIVCPYCKLEAEHDLLWRDTELNERLYLCVKDECRKEFLTNESKEVIETYDY